MSALYLYPIWMRLWHWLNAVIFIVLMVTGASMHFSGTPWLLSFNTAVPIHNASGILLTISWVVFIVGNLFTTNGRHYRVQFRGFFQRLFAQMGYYGYGIFRNAPHPFHVTEEMKLNTLQQISYIGVMYGLMPFLIISGWAFLYSVYLPETLFGIGILWLIAMAHLTLAYFLVMFLIVHMYIITTGETLTTNLRAMFTGWHRETDQH
ncbi:cytochrome b/b6 domain-containing protein [Thiorhodovibrio frisius]|uniref:Thiosulfate reductase cytochrome B subunit (Membrane anchoring protein) n=1 Tax=Thiorhodovibrio frisius TaxID=631362 RepID=H8Z5L5_9GAMM|nr:cytochrome b/b6 domain-containing protein [Thiorhodovibrio frisius]EIC20585.1 thiosulfate reductase cytochrome B subunit (membrane anchoring protein) [Thiorhodovibrio frisius]WPL21334.1 thiosulfate reductase cytochrome b subunit [Thiorhodovibrio frisius]